MCVHNIRCGAWISLDSIGISAEGCLRNSAWLQTLSLPSSHSTSNPMIYVDVPQRRITCLKTVSHGSFGYIDVAQEQTIEGVKEVYVKRPILPGKSLLYEACIQKWVGEELSAIGFLQGAPKVTRIFRLHDRSTCFAMEPIEGAVTLDRYLESLPVAQLSNVIIDCLLQLCAMVWHLNNKMGMNHRDVKPSNFLIVEHDHPETKVLVIEHEMIELVSTHSLTLIDFGFSCIGSTETQNTELSLSTVYPKNDPCPKEGRDLYLFLGLLYIDYHEKLAPCLLALFESWLQEPGSSLCRFMRMDKDHSKKWLYFMVGNTQIKRFHSCPQRIVSDLQTFR
jgi:serine/threonine protein kinase